MADAAAPSREIVPVTLLTGFLGSGKTTLLKKLLAKPGMADTAVIINEFGEVGLDHLLVAKGEENVVLLDSGCLCCMISNALNETLADLWFRRARGELPRFKRAVVETSGLADPAPILHMLMTDYFVAAHYALDGIVTTIDGLHGAAQLATHSEAVKQAAVADRILVTKGDLAGSGATAALREQLAALNPTARLLEVVDGEIDPRCVLDIGLFDPARKSLDVRRWLGEEALSDHDHAAHRHDARIASFCLYLDGPASWQGYAAWLQALKSLSGPDLLRVKGLIEIDGGGRPYVIQGVQHVFSPPLRLAAWPAGERRARLVFITRGIGRAAIAATLGLLRSASADPGVSR